MDSPINILSLCSGIGGLDLAIHLAIPGARTVCYVEREAYCCEILASRMEENALAPAPIWTDLRTFGGDWLNGVVDIVAAGYPCQPFSCAGKRAGRDDPRHLWPEVARIVGEAQPRLVFLENVAGHLVLGFDEVVSELERLGYCVAGGLFTAEEIGATHKRERLFILADGGGPRRQQDTGSASSNEAQNARGSAKYGDEPASSGDNVADSEQSDVLKAEAGWADESGRALAAGTGDAVDDTSISRRFGQHQEYIRRKSIKGNIPLFPPGPYDIDAWRRVLEIDERLAPAVESHVRRMADESAPMLDRLRALGNGVVPLQGAYAFLSLYAALQVNR